MSPDPSLITTNPKQLGGRPCVRGMRLPVADVLRLMAHGHEPLAEWPYLTPEDVAACLAYAADALDRTT